jgi:hypothetical protein
MNAHSVRREEEKKGDIRKQGLGRWELKVRAGLGCRRFRSEWSLLPERHLEGAWQAGSGLPAAGLPLSSKLTMLHTLSTGTELGSARYLP